MAKKTNVRKVVKANTRKSQGVKATQQVTTAIERLKKKAKDRGQPLTRKQISKARGEMRATIARQQARRRGK